MALPQRRPLADGAGVMNSGIPHPNEQEEEMVLIRLLLCLCLMMWLSHTAERVNGFQRPEPVPPAADFSELMDRNCQEHTVVLMDSILCFSETQWEKALELVSAQWDPAWNEEMQAMSLRVWGSDRIEMVGNLNFEELKPLLNEKQVETLDQIEVFASVDFLDLLRLEETEELERGLQKNKERLLQLTELKLSELDGICGIDNKQLELLRVARNGLATRTLARWQRTIESYQKDSDDKEVQKDAMSLIRSSLLGQCTDNDVWKQTLKKVFTEEQQLKILKREALRVDATQRQFVNDMVVFWMIDRCKLRPGQYLELAEMISGKLKLRFGAEMLEAERQIAQIPEEDFRKILEDQQWEALRPALAHMRDQ